MKIMKEELFVEKFREYTKRQFEGKLRLSSVSYVESNMLLHLNFIAEYDYLKAMSEDEKNLVKIALNNIFPKDKDSKFEYEYEIHPTHADKTSIFNVITKYFGKTSELVLKYIVNDPNCIEIILDPREIELNFKLNTTIYFMFTSTDIVQRLKYYLEHNFVQEFLIKCEEVKSIEEEVSTGFIDTIADSGNTRCIDYVCKDKVYSKFKIQSLTKRCSFIMDAKPVSVSSDYKDNEIILCGMIQNFAITKYKNKNYTGDPGDVEPPEKVRVNFILDDTTSKINCVIFPKKDSEVKALNLIHQGQEVVCLGSLSDYNGKVSYSIVAIFNADIDYKSIVLDYVKPTPRFYRTVEPQPFTYERVESFIKNDFEVDTNSSLFRDKTYVIFDTESTGKNTQTDEIIEIAAIKIVNGVATESFATLIDPRIHIPDELTKNVHHISDDMVKGQPFVEDVIPDFYKFTRDAILVGHNVDQFDYPLVNKYMIKEQYRFNNPTFDTVTQSRKLFNQEIDKFDLASLVKHFNLENNSPHRALSDVCATFDLMQVIGKYLDR